MSNPRPLGHHVMMRLVTSQVIAPTTATQRAAARVLHEAGDRRGLLAFRVADTHAHAVLLGSREEAGRFAHRASLGMRWHLELAAPFDRARFEPIEHQRHLERALLYVLRQEERHDIRLDLRHEASSAPDLLSMRVIAPALPARLHRALPRFSVEGLPDLLHLERADPDFARLADAACAALALPDLDARSLLVTRARLAAVRAAPDLSSGELSERLAVTRRCIERLRHRAAPDDLVEAIRRQLTYRSSRTPRTPP